MSSSIDEIRLMNLQVVRRYYYLAKPGIIYGNLITAIAAYVYGSGGAIVWVELLAMGAGTSLVIASGCIANNIIDAPLDAHMERTKNRSLVRHSISVRAAGIYSAITGIAGFFILIKYTNLYTAAIGAVGWIFYVIVYAIAKRRSVHGTLVGTVPGATPPVAGYVAATHSFDVAALLLFFILVAWQMPHFYAIAVRRLKDYKTARIPVLPAVKGFAATRKQIIAYIAAFMISVIVFAYIEKPGILFIAVMTITSLRWLSIALEKSYIKDQINWAKKVFQFSLITLLIFNGILATSALLP